MSLKENVLKAINGQKLYLALFPESRVLSLKVKEAYVIGRKGDYDYTNYPAIGVNNNMRELVLEEILFDSVKPRIEEVHAYNVEKITVTEENRRVKITGKLGELYLLPPFKLGGHNDCGKMFLAYVKEVRKKP